MTRDVGFDLPIGYLVRVPAPSVEPVVGVFDILE